MMKQIQDYCKFIYVEIMNMKNDFLTGNTFTFALSFI